MLRSSRIQSSGTGGYSRRTAMFTEEQLKLIADAVEDYGILVDEDAADQCGEILDIIEAHFINKDWKR